MGFWLFLAFSLISWQLSSTCKYPNISFSFYDKVMKHTVYSDVFSRQEMMYKVYFVLKKNYYSKSKIAVGCASSSNWYAASVLAYSSIQYTFENDFN